MYEENMVQTVADKTGMRAEKVQVVLDSVIEAIIEAVADGESVLLMGFGSFVPERGVESWEVESSSGEKIEIPNALVPTFRVARDFRDKVAVQNAPKKVRM